MQRMHGILHETSVHTAEKQGQSYSNSSRAGHKRTISDATQDSAGKIFVATGPTHFKRAASLPITPSRLVPSKIVDFRTSLGISEYSQRREFAATPSSTIDPDLDLASLFYALPPNLVANFASLGIKNIYPWQKSCLKGPDLLNGFNNLVYCAPTGGGKSLVADCEQPVCSLRL